MCIYLEASIQVLIIIQCEGVQGGEGHPQILKYLKYYPPSKTDLHWRLTII